MDFIERMFGISPDGGDGSTELMLLTVLVLICRGPYLAMVVQKIFRKGLITPSRGGVHGCHGNPSPIHT